MKSQELSERSFRSVYKDWTITQLLPDYFAWAEYDLHLAPKTLRGYREGLERVVHTLGDRRPTDIRAREILALKAAFARRNIGPYWSRNILNALRSFLRFAGESLELPVLDRRKVTLPRIPRREVVYLTSQEIEVFLRAIPLRGKKGPARVRWLCFRALVEVLLGTGMRITEALSLTRAAINFEAGEARIVGKGNKQRTVFFSARSLEWLTRYFVARTDRSERAFALPDGTPVVYDTVRFWFRRVRRKAGLKKTVTAHIMRHTCATTLLFNGCPVGHIKEILGHERLETTCRYYLGTDKSAAKSAHRKYLEYEDSGQSAAERD